MTPSAGLVTKRLRTRHHEIEEAIFAHVNAVVSAPATLDDSDYARGLRLAVAAAIDFGLSGIEHGEKPPVPAEAVAQARRAARHGVSLDTVLRRYILGTALLGDYIIEEADRAAPASERSGVREMLRAQSSLLDKLLVTVAREHICERRRTGRSGEQRLSERVRMLLGNEPERLGDTTVGNSAVEVELESDADLGYELDAEHLGIIAKGPAAQQALRVLASALDRRLLCVSHDRDTVWAWLAGSRALRMPDLERALAARTSRLAVTRETSSPADVVFAVGEPAWGLEGWRLTHRQAQAAFLVALRLPQRLTRYGEVALLAAALKDKTLGRSLRNMYLLPLEDSRNGAPVLRETLRAYLAAERNASSAAAALGVARNTVENRLRAIETKLGRSLHPCPAELEVALHLDRLVSSAPDKPRKCGDDPMSIAVDTVHGG
ncbi:MAG TPA: helix-turn-helix domain-containing protein [Solirubrobacteraceae bacterium]|jgi:hypothetical protein